MRFKEGERVSHEYLGDGKVTKVIKSAMDSRHNAAYMVLFDHCPPVGYNMGHNPCMVFPSTLKKQNQKEKQG